MKLNVGDIVLLNENRDPHQIVEVAPTYVYILKMQPPPDFFTWGWRTFGERMGFMREDFEGLVQIQDRYIPANKAKILGFIR